MCSLYRKRFRYNSLRYAGRDYSRSGKYFVTICTARKEKWFGNVINGEIKLSEIGCIASKMWCEIPLHFPFVVPDEFVVMPNHIHGIIIINRSIKTSLVGTLHATPLPTSNNIPMINKTMSSISPKSGTLSVIIRSYKSAVSKHAHKLDSGFSWQSGFYDNIICTTGQLSRIRKYILDNLKNW